VEKIILPFPKLEKVFLAIRFTLKVKYQNRTLRMQEFLFPFTNFKEMNKEIQIRENYP
jgi:hypothetical protein